MTTSYWQQSLAATAVLEADFAIVGGGVMGCATAYWLRHNAPDARIVLLEAGKLAQGASGRNAGFILQGVTSDFAHDVEKFGREKARRLLRFTKANRDLVSETLDAEAFGFRGTGSWVAAGSASEAAWLRRAASLLKEENFPAEWHDADATNATLHAQQFRGSLFLPTNGCLHPVRLVRYLAEKSGATVLENHAVTDVTSQAGAFEVQAGGRRVRAGRVLLTLNAYLPRLLPLLAPVVRPVRAQMLATVPGLPPLLDAPVYSHEGYYYVRQLPDGRVLLGGARHRHASGEIGYEDRTTDPLQRDLETYLADHFPAWAEAEIAMRWSGTMGFSPDGLPVVGPVPEHEGIWFAAGFTGHGMGYAVRMGRLLAELLLDHPSPEDYDLFAAARLG